MRSTTFAIALLISAAVPAFADPASVAVRGSAPLSSGIYTTRQTMVSYGDLDTATADGAAALVARLKAASEAVCGKPFGANAGKVTACREQALKMALKDTGLPRLTEMQSN